MDAKYSGVFQRNRSVSAARFKVLSVRCLSFHAMKHAVGYGFRRCVAYFILHLTQELILTFSEHLVTWH